MALTIRPSCSRVSVGSFKRPLHTRRQSTHHFPSTIDTGFILSLPKLSNPATSDPAYQRILKWYLPPAVFQQLWPRLEKFGDEAVSDRINEHISDAEKHPPYVKTRNVWGAKYPKDRLVTSEGWKRVGEWGIKNGLVIRCREPSPPTA
jgi:hypothetical protein